MGCLRPKLALSQLLELLRPKIREKASLVVQVPELLYVLIPCLTTDLALYSELFCANLNSDGHVIQRDIISSYLLLVFNTIVLMIKPTDAKCQEVG